ncbi:unnamed protein product [Microthlaspi erraticum]|uniref:TF-B3 domain-containing protein n=1 Tax=Microthlaspi erraticum TaxID=1685480 RepID=A0A6D2J6V7_9BRAS|nr:unnamed protein product [Microthlaspi erraticum]
MKKHLLQRTGESLSSNEDKGGDEQDTTELSREKKVKKNISEAEADSCFVARVTASNLQNDALAGEISVMKTAKKQEGIFIFTLMENRKTPSLSFCPAESRGEKEIKKGSLPVEPSSGKQISKEERKKNHLKCKDSASQCQNRFVTLTITHDSLRKGRLHLPLPFMRENGLDNFEMITLLCKDGEMFLANLRREAIGRMSLGRAWKSFAKANSLKTGESFALEIIWKYKTPMLSFLHTVPSSDRRQQEDYRSEPISGSNNREVRNKSRYTYGFVDLEPKFPELLSVVESEVQLPIQYQSVFQPNSGVDGDLE